VLDMTSSRASGVADITFAHVSIAGGARCATSPANAKVIGSLALRRSMRAGARSHGR
jgi:hypothetical protein